MTINKQHAYVSAYFLSSVNVPFIALKANRMPTVFSTTTCNKIYVK